MLWIFVGILFSSVASPSISSPFPLPSHSLSLCLSICQRYSQVNPLCGYAPSWNSESLAQVSRVSPISLCIAVLQLVWFLRFPYGSRDHTPSVPHCEALALATPLSTEWEREDGTTGRRRRAECRGTEGGTEVTHTTLKMWKYALKCTWKKGGRQLPPVE